MKVLNERNKKFRGIAMQNLVTGSKKEKEAAKRFLLDIGLSDEAISKIEGKNKVEESVCGCMKDKKKKKCNKCEKEIELKEEEVKTGVNSLESAQQFLQAKKIGFNKTEKVGDKTVFKQGDTIVGAWHPSWGTVKTGENLLDDKGTTPSPATKPTTPNTATNSLSMVS
jgi:hypothetical protein